ncbi:MAG: nuclear transport factor 2 family protein [Collimonas sp.]
MSSNVETTGTWHATPTATDVVRQFWDLMASNDFWSVGAILSDDFVIDWPQSNERIRGRDNFARMNAEYPCNGRWIFTINQLVGNGSEVVSDVNITDGIQHPQAISFFTVMQGKITFIREYWPASYPAPANRQHLVEPIR